MKKLTKRNQEEFFKRIKVGEVFTYSDSFIFIDVKELAEKNRISLEYCSPGTEEYRQNGCFTCKVVGKELINYDNYFKGKMFVMMLDEDVNEKIIKLKKHFGVNSKSDIVRLAVRRLYKDEIVS